MRQSNMMTPWEYHLYAIRIFNHFCPYIDWISTPRKPKKKKKKKKKAK